MESVAVVLQTHFLVNLCVVRVGGFLRGVFGGGSAGVVGEI